MAAPEDEAIKIFGDLVNAFEALVYTNVDQVRVNGLLRQTKEAIKLTFSDQSSYLKELDAIKLFPARAKVSNRPFYFETGKQKVIAILNNILVNLRLSRDRLDAVAIDPILAKRTVSSPTEIKSGFVFIAMSMTPDDPALEDVHEAIKEVAREIGLSAERIDDPVTNEKITDRIVESIRRAEYVVVDLTHSKPNVYWEAGYAQALDKTPIYVARRGTTIEFDLKDYPVIFFNNVTQLKRELTKRLEGLQTEKGNS